jgi:hypothetical protein
MTGPTPSDDLQFSTAEPSAPLSPDSDARSAATCAECARPITTHYYTIAGRTMCGSCKANVERALAGGDSSRAGRVTKSLLLGAGAALLGAVAWYLVEAMFGLRIGLVAILIGWMVGRAVQMGSGGRGGQRYQVIAATLTYLSIVSSYAALGYGDGRESFMLPVLPIVVGIEALPRGIIGLAIIAFGIHQAWQMNAAVVVPITGPHRIGNAPNATA